MQSLLSDDEIRTSVKTIQHGRNVTPARHGSLASED
jgi:hypothetical protein